MSEIDAGAGGSDAADGMDPGVASVLRGESRFCVVHGDALDVLGSLPNGSIGGVITDPPYASGGLHVGSRRRPTSEKYIERKRGPLLVDFSGDQMDQLSWMLLARVWLQECRRATRQDCYGRLGCFIDWRQLPSLASALQWAGWLWQGIVTWDKGAATRPVPHGFRHQCEYVLWAATTTMPVAEPGVTVIAGCHQIPVSPDKIHQTEKPLALMRELVRVVPADGIVVDPFCGSGTTLVAALLEGRRAIGVERVAEYVAVARQRCAAAAAGECVDRRVSDQTAFRFDLTDAL